MFFSFSFFWNFLCVLSIFRFVSFSKSATQTNAWEPLYGFLHEEIMNLMCNCNCHAFRLTKLQRRKVISIENYLVFYFAMCLKLEIAERKKCGKKMCRGYFEMNGETKQNWCKLIHRRKKRMIGDDFELFSNVFWWLTMISCVLIYLYKNKGIKF